MNKALLTEKGEREQMNQALLTEKGEREQMHAALKKTEESLEAFRAALGRSAYLDQIASAIITAKEDIVFTTSTMEASWHTEDQRKIFDAVKQRFSNVPKQNQENSASKFRHRGLVAKKPGTLPGTIELICLTGVDVKMTPVLAMSRLRFLVQDRRKSIIGLAEGPPELAREKPSTISFSLDSTMLALALHDRFETLWSAESSIDPMVYLSEFINEAKKVDESQTRATILRWLKAEKSDKARIHAALMEKCPAYRELPDGVV